MTDDKAAAEKNRIKGSVDGSIGLLFCDNKLISTRKSYYPPTFKLKVHNSRTTAQQQQKILYASTLHFCGVVLH